MCVCVCTQSPFMLTIFAACSLSYSAPTGIFYIKTHTKKIHENHGGRIFSNLLKSDLYSIGPTVGRTVPKVTLSPAYVRHCTRIE